MFSSRKTAITRPLSWVRAPDGVSWPGFCGGSPRRPDALRPALQVPAAAAIFGVTGFLNLSCQTAFNSAHRFWRAAAETLAAAQRRVKILTAWKSAIQESLSNIHRHSGAKKAHIKLARANSTVRLEIRDNGKGIAPELLSDSRHGKQVVGVGILGMRERLSQLDGTVKVSVPVP